MKKFKVVLSVAVMSLVMVGCGAPQIKTASEAYLKTTVNTDKYSKDTWIKGPDVYQNKKATRGIELATINMRALIKNNKVKFYQAYVWDGADDWRFYSRAIDANGRNLDFVSIDRSVSSGASTIEEFAINFSRSYLNAHRKSGINFKAYGKGYEKEYYIPGFIIDGFLKKVDEVR